MAKTPTTNINKAADQAHSAVDKAAEAVQSVEQTAKEKAQLAKAKADDTIETVKAVSQETKVKVSDYINDNPLKAVGIAFGAGLIAAALLRK